MSNAPPARAPDWLLYQLADSAFPAGAFAHSGGLEAAWQQGEVPTAEALHDALLALLHQAARAAVPFAAACCREPNRFAEVDAACDVFLSNHVANRASRAQGRALLSTARKVYDLPRPPCPPDAPRHVAPVFGWVAGRLGIDPARTAGLLLFTTLRGGVSAAVRLGICGPIRGQSIQAALSPEGQRLAIECCALPVDQAAQTAPLLDLLQATHERLYSRLFVS